MCQYLIKMTYGGVKVLEYSVCPCIDIVSIILMYPGGLGVGVGFGFWFLTLSLLFPYLS